MSNKLKTLSAAQLEQFISSSVSDYVEEDCQCPITILDTPNINSEADVAIENKRSIRFEAEVSYLDE
jgi:hypothetical protein